jgi:hypothetical protein
MLSGILTCACGSRGRPPASVAPVDVKYKVVANEKMAKEYDGKRVRLHLSFQQVMPMREAPIGYDDSWSTIRAMGAEVEGGKANCSGGMAMMGMNSMIQVVAPNAMVPKMMDLKAQTVIEVVGIVRVGSVMNAIEIEDFKVVGNC